MSTKVKLFWEEKSHNSKSGRHFAQGEFIANFRKHSPIGREVLQGMCFGICTEAIRRSIVSNKQEGYSAEAILMSTTSRMNALTKSKETKDIEKFKKMAFRIYTQQKYLQDYLTQTPVIITTLNEKTLNNSIKNGNGISDIGLFGNGEGHALYIVRSESLGKNKEALYRIFDPNYGYSEAMPINAAIEQINEINKFYYKGAEKPTIGNLTSVMKELPEIKYLQPNAPKHCTKPNHVIRMLEGIHPINPKIKPDIDFKKMREDLGDRFLMHVIKSYCSDKNIKHDLAALHNFRVFMGVKNISEFYKDFESKHPNDFEKIFGAYIDEDVRLSSKENPTPSALENLLTKHPNAVLRMCVKEISNNDLPRDIDINILSFKEQRLFTKIAQSLDSVTEKKFPSLLDAMKSILNIVISALSNKHGLRNEEFKAAYEDLQTRLGINKESAVKRIDEERAIVDPNIGKLTRS